MLVELPDAASILTGLFIFLIGFIAIITYFKVKLYVNSKKIHKDPAQLERLEYYITSSSFSGKISLSFRMSICFDKSIITFISLAFITPKLSKSACV